MPDWNPETVEAQAAEAEKASQPEASQPEKQEVQEQTQTPERPKDTPEVELSRTKAALAEERSRRRGEAAARRALEQQMAGIQQELSAMRQQPRQAPDPQQQPVEAILHEQRQTQEQLRALQEQKLRESAESAQRQQVEAFVSHVRSMNEEFTKEQPDANDAINFLKSARVDEYKAMGMSHAEATQRMLHDELQLVQWAVGNGENPAKVAFDMARARGYVSGQKKLEMQRQGQQASLPTNASGRSGGKLSLESLAKMSGKDFAEATKGDAWEKLMRSAG